MFKIANLETINIAYTGKHYKTYFLESEMRRLNVEMC
mgnify:CR=1 FL=1